MLIFKYAPHGNAVVPAWKNCVLHCASVTFDSATLLRTMLELTVDLSKQKESKHPQLTVAFYLHWFK